MLKGNHVIIPAVFIVLAVFCVAAFSQEDMEFIDNTVFDHPLRPPVVFSHDHHNEMAEIEECNACHHVYENGILQTDESSEDTSCSECHDPVYFGKGLSLMKAFHKNCKGCHLKHRKGPILCGECHKKQK